MRVLPYEHRGAKIREMQIRSDDDARVVYGMFVLETDEWLRKMLALKLLDYVRIDELEIHLDAVVIATKCQVKR